MSFFILYSRMTSQDQKIKGKISHFFVVIIIQPNSLMESKYYCDFCDFKNTYYFGAWCLVRSKAVFSNHWFDNCWNGRPKFIFSNRVCLVLFICQIGRPNNVRSNFCKVGGGGGEARGSTVLQTPTFKKKKFKSNSP